MMKTFFFYYTILLTLHIQLHSNVRPWHSFNAEQEFLYFFFNVIIPWTGSGSPSACGAWWCNPGTCGRGPRPPSVPPRSPPQSPPPPPRTPVTAYTGYVDCRPQPATENIVTKNSQGSIVYQTQQQHCSVTETKKQYHTPNTIQIFNSLFKIHNNIICNSSYRICITA